MPQPRSPRLTTYAAAPGALATAPAPVEVTATRTLPQRWRGAIGFENQMTGDGRMIERNALIWELPWPLRFVLEDVGQHSGAQSVGTAESVLRRPNGELYAEGTFDLGSAAGREAARRSLETQGGIGVSMDLDSVTFEIRIAGDIFAQLEAQLADLMADPDDMPEEDTAPKLERDAEGRVTIMKVSPDDEVQVTTSARIRAATIVDIPAFADARISADPDSLVEVGPLDEGAALAAGGSPALPIEPPAEWFSAPRFSSPTALTITDEGQVFGHLALWGTCHISHAGSGECVTPPHSAAGYAYFHTGAIRTQGGTEIPVGHLTLDTTHANLAASPAATLAHYENTGAVVADIAVGEDSHGIWVAGSLRPSATPDQIRALRAAPLSGDWRQIGSNLELVAALAVNVPGFPVPRPAGMVASGAITSLVAAGMVTHHSLPAVAVAALSSEDLRYLKSLISRERRNEARAIRRAPASTDDLSALARRVRLTTLAARVHQEV